MSITNTLDLQAVEALRMTRSPRPQLSDTVIVKLRSTPRSVRLLSAAAGLGESVASAPQTVLASLVERGYVSENHPRVSGASIFRGGAGTGTRSGSSRPRFALRFEKGTRPCEHQG